MVTVRKIIVHKMVKTICHDLLPDIIGYVSIDNLRYLRNVSSVIDRIMRYLKKCVFFGLSDIAYDLSGIGSLIIKLSSGKCIGLIKNTEYNGIFTNVEVYSRCYQAIIDVCSFNSSNLYNRIDIHKNIMLYRSGHKFVVTHYSGIRAPKQWQIIQIHDKLQFMRPEYIDLNTCYAVSFDRHDNCYYESFTVICKDGSWQ